jgi:PAS domain S-box-containing protein
MAPETQRELLARIRDLEQRLQEAEDTLHALRSGEVDAVVAAGPDGDRIYTLAGADEAYRIMVQSMALGALTLTRAGLVLFSNERFAGIVESPLERVIGSRIHDYVEPRDADIVSAVLGGRTGQNAEVRLRTGTGTLVPVSLSAQNLDLNAVECLCLIVTDLREQKRNEAIVSAERLARLVLEQAAEAILVVDPEGRVIRASRAAERLAGIPVVQRGFDEVFRIGLGSGADYPFREILSATIRAGSFKDMEVTAVEPDGRKLELLMSAALLSDSESELLGCVLHLNDITERKLSEDRLRQAQKLESIGILAGGIAHDFNNLLVGVIGNATLALEMLPPQTDGIELIEGVIKSGEQLAHLTRQMLAYSGKGRFLVERLDLSSLIPLMSELVQPSISKKIALDFELERSLPPIEADRSQIQQVYMNLLLNAAEAIGNDNGLIQVKTGLRTIEARNIGRRGEAVELPPGQYVYLDVRDSGCGMDLATQAKIFDPFFTTKFIGRGLGLAAVSGIVRGHKGAIEVTSAPGKGSCFTVMFPAAPRAMDAAQVPHDIPGPDRTATILLVDDEEIVRGMAKMLLSRHGFKVLVAANGIEAIDLFKRHPADIAAIVIDLSMPGMSGVEALRELRKIRPGVKAIVSSGYTEAETMALFEGQRVSGFIQKPYMPRRLVDKLRSALA